MLFKLISRLSLVLALVISAPALAQYGPPTPANNNGGGDVLLPVGQALDVPAYIKPGFQMIYMSGSSTEGNEAGKGGSAGMGFTEYSIIAVLEDKVIVSAANYLTPNGMPLTAQGAFDPMTDPQAQLTGSNVYAISKLDIQGGNAMWMSPDELRNMQSGNGVEVQRGPWLYKGQQVNSATITVKGGDFISGNTYKTDDGMKPISRNASGPMRRNATGANPYDRRLQSQMSLLDTRQFESPLINAPWPDWAKTVKTMNYVGSYSMAVPGMQAPAVPMTMQISFTERGEGYAIGKSRMQVQNSPPTESAVAQGPGSVLGYWVHPAVLANLQQGVVDQNKTMRTRVTYQVQQGNLGQLGVFVLTNATESFYAVSGYNLQTGALAYVSLSEKATGTTVQFQLTGTQ